MNDRRSRGLLAALLFALSLSSFAQVETLTLKEAIRRAHQDGPAVAVARQTFAARRAGYESFEAGLLPRVAVQGQAPGYYRSITSVVQPDGSTVFAQQSQTNATLGLTVTQPIPWTGGELSLGSTLQRIDLLESHLTSYRSTPLSLSYRQPLFQINALRWDVESQAMSMEVARRGWAETLEEISVNVTSAFFEMAVLQISMEISSKNAQINDTLYQISVGRFNVGKIAENELLQSELAALNARMQLATATTSYERARVSFCQTLGMPRDARLHLVLPDAIPELRLDAAQAVDAARRRRSDLVIQELDLHNAERALARVRLTNSFTGLLTLNAGFNQRAGTVPDAYRHLLDQQQFSVSFELPILQWGAGSSAVESATADRDRIVQTGVIRQNDLENEVTAQVASLDLLRSQVLVTAKAETIAVRRFEVSKDRYLIGKIDVTNLFLAQNEQDAARRSRVQTLAAFWTGYYRLRRLTLHDFAAGQPIEPVLP
jgi:outer membrane protein TolC